MSTSEKSGKTLIIGGHHRGLHNRLQENDSLMTSESDARAYDSDEDCSGYVVIWCPENMQFNIINCKFESIFFHEMTFSDGILYKIDSF